MMVFVNFMFDFAKEALVELIEIEG